MLTLLIKVNTCNSLHLLSGIALIFLSLLGGFPTEDIFNIKKKSGNNCSILGKNNFKIIDSVKYIYILYSKESRGGGMETGKQWSKCCFS